MNKEKITKMFKNVKRATEKHSPEILTGIGIAGMITTTVLAVKATPKALLLIEETKEEKRVYDESDDEWVDEPLTKMEVVRTTWKCYIPAITTGTMSIICLIGASSVNYKRNAALATAYTLSETALKEYREKVIETIGEKKESQVRDAIAKDKIAKNPVVNKEIIITEKGNTLCYDTISGRYFKSDIDKLRKIENELNRRMMDDVYITLNELYYEIGLNPTKLGEDLGWNINRGLIELRFSSQLTEDEEPCLVLDYRIEPKYDFKNY